MGMLAALRDAGLDPAEAGELVHALSACVVGYGFATLWGREAAAREGAGPPAGSQPGTSTGSSPGCSRPAASPDPAPQPGRDRRNGCAASRHPATMPP
jgi:hypothetical protein